MNPVTPPVMMRPVTVVASHSVAAAFVPTTSIPHPAPVVLDADNLRDAARLRERYAVDALVLLRIDVSAKAVDGGSAIPFAADSRRLAGLIGDAVRVQLASGAVLVGADSRLVTEVLDALARAGFRTNNAIAGWCPDDLRLARIG